MFGVKIRTAHENWWYSIKVDVLAFFGKFTSHRPVLYRGGWKKHAGPFTSELLVAETRLNL